jgi:hypothetical protein
MPPSPQAAQRGHVPVADPSAAQRLGKRAAVELRVEAGPWQRADIQEKRNARAGEERKKRFDAPVGMTDGVEGCQTRLLARMSLQV